MFRTENLPTLNEKINLVLFQLNAVCREAFVLTRYNGVFEFVYYENVDSDYRIRSRLRRSQIFTL